MNEKVINLISKNIGFITVIILILSIIVNYYSNQYDLTHKTYEVLKNNKVVEETIWFLTNKSLILSVINTFLLNLSIAMIITFFILRFIEKKEKESFYKKLQEFQKETAKDAIKSIFERIVDPEFFRILEKDVLNAKFLRKNVKWDYDFSINYDGRIQLKRTIIYTLKNITNDNEIERFEIISENNIHSNVINIECKYKKMDEEEYKIIEMEKREENHKIKASQEITIKANEEIQVIISWTEIFGCDYVYATHLIRFPIIGLELNVNFPENENYHFEIIVDTFSNKLEKIYGPVDGKIKYQVNEALYKGQGIEFLLYKKESESD